MLRAFLLILIWSVISLGPLSFSADLDLDPIMLYKCWRAFRKLNTKATPTIPIALSKKVGNELFTVPTFTSLNSNQIQKLFSVGSEGASATANGLSYRTVDGTLTVLFWPRSQFRSEGSISHREAVEKIMQGELQAIESYLSQSKNQKLQLLLDAKENLTDLLGLLRNSPQIPKEISERFFGFQVNAKSISPKREMKIESIDFDPNLNGRSEIGSVLGWTEELQNVINMISRSIPTKYSPEFYRIDESLLNSYMGPLQLKAPAGSKIIELKP